MMMPSPLTPTPRTDENSRTAIRHVKSTRFRDFFSTLRIENGRITTRPMMDHYDQLPLSELALQAPIVGPSAEDRARVIHASISRLPNANSIIILDSFIEDYARLYEARPELARVMDRCLMTGTEPARLVSLRIANNCFNTSRQITMDTRFGDSFTSQFNERWNAMNVGEETGLSHTLNLNTACRIIDIGSASGTYKWTDAEWRGFAALRLAIEVPGGRELADGTNVYDFIGWAGNQEDLRRVVELVRERGTVSPETLEPLLAESQYTHSAVHGGLL